MAVRKGQKLAPSYKAEQKRLRPSIKIEDYDEWNRIQYAILFEEKTRADLDLMIRTYNAWNEDKGEEFHKLVGVLRAQFRV